MLSNLKKDWLELLIRFSAGLGKVNTFRATTASTLAVQLHF